MGRNKFYLYGVTLFIISLFAFVIGCSSKKKDVVAEIGNEKIYLYEFESQFLKSVGNNTDTAKVRSLAEKKDYLDLIIKFRLKVKDARERGLLNSPEIQKDLQEYQKNFISTFLIDKEIIEPNIKELWERKKFEVRASHILVNVPQTGNPDDSVKAFKKAEDIINRLKNGEDFGAVAKEMSDDQSAKNNNGDLYYFTAGMTVPEFEDAIYSMKIGEYTKKPIRTMFGLHIVKLTDKKKRYESIRASHILIQDIKDSVTGKVIDSVTSLNKAKDILASIKKGEDFTKLAADFSDDPGSKTKGGDLGFFDRRRMIQPFDSAAFSLKPGEVSDIVRTPFGWHIIKLIEVKEYLPFDKQKETLKAEFKRGQTYKTAYNNYLEKARKDYNFEFEQNNFGKFIAKFDSNKVMNNHNLDSMFSETDKQMVIAKYKGGELKINDVIQYLNTNKEYSSSAANFITIKRIVEGCGEAPILNAISIKEKIDKDEDYIDMLKEYENGLLSFKIDQEELWSKIKITDEDISKYYESNKPKYTITENNEQKVKSIDEVRAEISQALQQDKFKEMEKTYVDKLREKYPVKINDKVLEKAFKN